MVFGLSPVNEVFVLSLLLSFVLALLYRVLVNPGKMRSLKADVKAYQQKMKQLSADKEAQAEFMGEMMKANQRMMKANMKPMLGSLVVVGVSLQWLATTYVDAAAALPFSIPFIGATANWFWIYVLVTAPFVYVFRKLMGAV